MKLFTNLLYLSGAEMASKVVTFAAIAYIARVAGPVGFGYVEFAGSVLLCAGLIVDQGLGSFGAREIARAPERTPQLFSEVVLARLLLAVLAYALVLGFALVLNPAWVVLQLLVIYGLSLVGTPFLLQWVFQGHDQMRTVAALNLLRQTVYAIVVFALVRSADRLWFVAVAEVAGVSSAALVGVWLYRRRFREAAIGRWRLSARLLREAAPIGLGQVFWTARMFGATVIMGLVALPQDVGFFGAAMRILIALHAFIYLYYFNLLPSLARAWQQGGGSGLSRMTAQSLRVVIWAALCAGVAWWLAAPAVAAAVYGSAFAPAGAALQLLAVVAVAAALSGHYRFGLIAAGGQAAEMAAQALGSALAVALIPVGYARLGINGAALALVAGELLVWLSTWLMARAWFGVRNHAGLYIRPLLALALTSALVLVLPPVLPLRLGAAAGLIGLLALLTDGAVRASVGQGAAAARRVLRRLLTRRVPETAQIEV